MGKQYKFMRVDPITVKNFNLKAERMNMELRKAGVKTPRINTIDVIREASKRPFYLDTKELIKLTKHKIKEI